MKITVDRALCAGLGICESLAPDVFEIDDDGDLVLLTEIVPDGLAADVEAAAASCPAGALRLL